MPTLIPHFSLDQPTCLAPILILQTSANQEVFVGIPECPRNARFGKSIQLATLAEPRLRSFLQMDGVMEGIQISNTSAI